MKNKYAQYIFILFIFLFALAVSGHAQFLLQKGSDIEVYENNSAAFNAPTVTQEQWFETDAEGYQNMEQEQNKGRLQKAKFSNGKDRGNGNSKSVGGKDHPGLHLGWYKNGKAEIEDSNEIEVDSNEADTEDGQGENADDEQYLNNVFTPDQFDLQNTVTIEFMDGQNLLLLDIPVEEPDDTGVTASEAEQMIPEGNSSILENAVNADIQLPDETEEEQDENDKF